MSLRLLSLVMGLCYVLWISTSVYAADPQSAEKTATGTQLSETVEGNSEGVEAQQDAADNTQQPIQYKQDTVGQQNSFGKIAAVFILLLVLAAAVMLALKKKLSIAGLLPSEKGKHIELLDRQALHADHAVYYVAVDNKHYLITVGNGHSSVSKVD